MVAHAHVRSFLAAMKAVSIKGAQGLLLVSVLLTALSPMPVAAKRSVMATVPAQSRAEADGAPRVAYQPPRFEHPEPIRGARPGERVKPLSRIEVVTQTSLSDDENSRLEQLLFVEAITRLDPRRDFWSQYVSALRLLPESSRWLETTRFEEFLQNQSNRKIVPFNSW